MAYALSYITLTIPMILGITENISPIFPIIFYFLMTMGDNMVYPIGNSITAKLSPKSFETQMQSAWSQSTSIANGITMILLKFFTTSDSQMTLFPIMAVVLIITSVVVFLFRIILKKTLHSMRRKEQKYGTEHFKSPRIIQSCFNRCCSCGILLESGISIKWRCDFSIPYFYKGQELQLHERTDSEEWNVGTVYEPKKKRTTVSLEQPVSPESVKDMEVWVEKAANVRE